MIPCRNEASNIASTLRSVFAQNPPEERFEVIVTDGMSDDGTRDIITLFAADNPSLRLIDNPGKIVSMGLNQAIRAARGRTIIRMDAHTEYAPDYLQQCVSVLRETGADNAGGPWVARGTGLLSRAIAAAFQSAFAVGGARGHRVNYEGSVDTVYLGCWPAETFRRFGFFDEELVRNQDDEHNLRITRGGGTVWQSPRIRSWYTPRGSLGALFRQYYQYGYWKIRVIQKHRLPASIRHLVPGVFIASLLVCLLGSPFSMFLRILGMIAGGIYLACLLMASIVTSARTEWRLASVLPAVLVTYHFGYGFGFLRGLIDFTILKRPPRASATILTRNR